MPVNFWFIGDKEDFLTSRSGRIGASDIAKIVPNPENPTESLAGYGNTALTVYQEKRGEREREPAGLAAEMGHFLENKALELFIRRFSGREIAGDFVHNKITYEMITGSIGNIAKCESYQSDLYKHNTQYYIDGMIAHPDCIYIGDKSLIGKPKKERVKIIDGIQVDLSKPFLIEAKSARLFAAKRPEGSIVKGYDTKLTSWQGIPLKHYMQIQYQLALFEIDVCYLALISDTSDFHIWRIDANKKDQGKIIDVVGLMLKCIEKGIMPRELAMNADDIAIMYPEIQKDFIMLNGEKLEAVINACKQSKKADQQIKNWKAIQIDAKNAIAVYLKDYEEIRNGSDVLAKWEIRGGSEKITKPKEAGKDSFPLFLKKNDKAAYRYLLKREYIKKSKDSRFVKVKFKGE